MQLIEEHPEFRAEFENAFCELWKHPERGPFEIIIFCMHSLRWRKVLEYFERELQAALLRQDWRTHSVAEDVVNHFATIRAIATCFRITNSLDVVLQSS